MPRRSSLAFPAEDIDGVAQRGRLPARGGVPWTGLRVLLLANSFSSCE